MDRIKLETIEERKSLSLYDLRKLYLNNVCDTITDYALSLMQPRELKHYIARAVYKKNVEYKTRQRTNIIKKISMLLAISVRTIEKLCPSNKTKSNARNTKSGGEGA